MNLDPTALRILCYGDSNTWGHNPLEDGERYPVTMRWPGILQKKLGKKFWVIEEGLGGRTTDIDDPIKDWKNGKRYLRPCLESHNPLDVIILFLGTNDLKEIHQRSPQQVADAIRDLVEMIHQFAVTAAGEPAKIILISPTVIDETVIGTQEKYSGAEAKSRQLGALYEQVALEYGCAFINLGEQVTSSKLDGYHLDPEAHQKVAELVEKKVIEIAGQ